MDNNLDAIFAGLADPTRRAVIEQLAKGPAPVSELHAPHAMALPTFLKHLGKLESAGLITTRKSGRVRTATLSPDALEPMQAWTRDLRATWSKRLDRLHTLASQMTQDPDPLATPEQET